MISSDEHQGETYEVPHRVEGKASCRITVIEVVLVAGAYLACCIVVLVAILRLIQGKMVYTLDDPYIHLAVAEEIAHGHYGVNPDEVSSPASSALWPVLLAPLARTQIGELMPLIINAACGVLTALILLRRLQRELPGRHGGMSALRILIALFVIGASNFVALTFCGMEHCLQILAAIVVTDGILGLVNGERPGKVFLATLILGPLVRYENLALSGIGCLMLGGRGYWKHALVCGLGAVAGLAAFSGFLVSLGLSPLPSSVLVKSSNSSSGALSLMERLKEGLDYSANCMEGLNLMILSSLLLIYSIMKFFKGPRAWCATILFMAGFAHVMVGHYGGQGRYVPYIYAALLFGGCILLFSSMLRRFHWMATAVVASVVMTFGGLSLLREPVRSIADLPTASNNIYEQQYQMHRFVTDYHDGGVAVNDLGWVSFRNEKHVLDLWGLASFEAFQARVPWRGPEWMEEMASSKHIQLAIIYHDWFTERPKSWVKLAEMKLSRRCVTPSSNTVSFYSTGTGNPELLRERLVAFRSSLPPGVNLTLIGESEAPMGSATRSN
ncbi:MAG: hypothetical protein CFE26_04960 [Verrucomicrobiales bacterium VVV1]|nr:MAG: hypothetical protein CFE26_04960 [Verrucomicrobiales bacterium VVV1]